MPSDWVTEWFVPLVAAFVGAAVGGTAVWLSARQQIRAASASVDRQFAEERRLRKEDKLAEVQEMFVAAREETDHNLALRGGRGGNASRPNMSIENLQMVLLSGRIVDREDRMAITEALTLAAAYNATPRSQTSTALTMFGDASDAMRRAGEAVSKELDSVASEITKLEAKRAEPK